jgi:hypothetical protein
MLTIRVGIDPRAAFKGDLENEKAGRQFLKPQKENRP